MLGELRNQCVTVLVCCRSEEVILEYYMNMISELEEKCRHYIKAIDKILFRFVRSLYF